jgi:hypothetical protein
MQGIFIFIYYSPVFLTQLNEYPMSEQFTDCQSTTINYFKILRINRPNIFVARSVPEMLHFFHGKFSPLVVNVSCSVMQMLNQQQMETENLRILFFDLVKDINITDALESSGFYKKEYFGTLRY